MNLNSGMCGQFWGGACRGVKAQNFCGGYRPSHPSHPAYALPLGRPEMCGGSFVPPVNPFSKGLGITFGLTPESPLPSPHHSGISKMLENCPRLILDGQRQVNELCLLIRKYIKLCFYSFPKQRRSVDYSKGIIGTMHRLDWARFV